MKFEKEWADSALLELIGERLGRLRLSKNMTQEQIAEQAGVGVRTVQRLELGEAATQLSGFLRICRVLGLVERLELFIPEEKVSPIAQLQLQGRKRQRATGRKKVAKDQKNWTWGDPT